MARGKRKSIVDEYKAKARGKKTSKVSPQKKTGIKKKQNKITPVRIPVTEMTIGETTYTKGDIAWYVLESTWEPKRPVTGEILECHPNDKTEPSLSVWCEGTKCYRTIRASLVGWSKAEAKKKWESFQKNRKDATFNA